MCYTVSMSKSESKNETKEVGKTSQKQIVIISVLATVLGCVVIFLIIAFAMGMIKFNSNDGQAGGDATSGIVAGGGSGANGGSNGGSVDNGGQLIDNPNPKVEVKTGNKVSVGNLEFYLPKHFKKGSEAGGGSELEVVYNLVDDDGWADVRIYVEKTGKDARDYLLSKNSRLTIEQDAWVINDWSWSTAYAAEGAIQAWATNYGDYVYAIILTVKLDSDQSNEAVMMIPKTLYFTKIYK